MTEGTHKGNCMFVRIDNCKPKGRGLGQLLLLTTCFYLPPVFAQEVFAVAQEPQSDLDSGAANAVQAPDIISESAIAQQGVATDDNQAETAVAEQRDEGDTSAADSTTEADETVIYKDQLPTEEASDEEQLPAEVVDAEVGSPDSVEPVTEEATDTVVDSAQAIEAPAEAQSDSRHIQRFGSGATEEWEMDLSVPTPAPAPRTTQVSQNALPDRSQNQELQSLLGTLAIEPGNAEVMSQLNRLLGSVLVQVNADLDAGNLGVAQRTIDVIQPIDPNLSGLRTAQRRLRLLTESKEFLRSGDVALEADKLIQPDEDNAYYFFSEAKTRDPNSAAAELGLARVQEGLIERANEAANAMDFEVAEQWLVWAAGIRENQTLVDGARALIANQQTNRGREMVASTEQAIDRADFDAADLLIIDLIALGGQDQNVTSLRAKLEDARYYSGFQPGQIISDPFLDGSDRAPDVVIIPSGSFVMGSEGSYDNEQPRHRVNIERGFGIGRTEVTVSQFRLFILRSGYRTVAEIGGSSKIYNEAVGRLTSRSNVTWLDGYNGDRANINSPAIHISWHDAQAYVKWLSDETGKKYRLPTEAEYEYVARAGGNTDYWWGEGTPAEAVENLTGEKDESPEGRQWTTFFDDYKDGHWGPAPVATLRGELLGHPFGVYDIAGNVSEWVEDCWHANYTQAPDTGIAWVNLGCERRVARGGYWASAPSGSRASFRISANPNTVGPVVGIRVARDL